ncbi:MAG: portal protein [bacterium]
MEGNARSVLKFGNKLFEDKRNLDSLWQEIALNFYPDRADFTYNRVEGEEFSDHLFSSFPVLARRELGNMMAASLRPRSQRWFSLHVDDPDLDEGDHERAFLEHLSEIQWRAMYDRATGFIRATKEADHDYAGFGNAVIKYGPNIARNGMLFQSFHLRDNAWSENAEGVIDVNHRNWTPTARQLVHTFGEDKVSNDVKLAFNKDPEQTFPCRHAVLPARIYPYKSKLGREFPFVSLFIERNSEKILEEVGLTYFCYLIPRWQTISGSAYAVSMATSIILPDSRTMQAVMRTLREAGEKYVDPPMIAIGDAIRGDISLYAGGITNADYEYDERLGQVLRPVSQDKGGMPIGFDIAEALKQDITSGFFLDKIQLPESNKEMTAFEVRRRLQEHIRASSPIFEPIIDDYNDPMCEGIFNFLMQAGAFPLDQMPETLSGADIKFRFRSPMHDLTEQNDAETYVDVMERILAPAAQLDPAQWENVDLTTSTRDAMRAAGWKAKWMKPPQAVEQKRAEMDQQAEVAETIEGVGAAGAAAKETGEGMSRVTEALTGPQQQQGSNGQAPAPTP